MRRAVPHILLLLLLLPTLSAAARSGGKVSGAMSWVYADYQAEGGRTTDADVDASSFAQHYSLIYSDKGMLNGGRGGTYLFSLGAEFVGVDNNINGVGESLTTYKPFYDGQLVVAPGGLPFRLKLFSSDLHVTTLLEDTNPLLSTANFAPGIATDFSNGRHRRTGATLAVGIKNGSYQGGYRDILSQFPRLLMDYQEYEVESFRSQSPQNYRVRDLAFVSLNKKENWFHYRFRDFQDYLLPSGANDYQTKIYLLGTIDPLLQRNWINLTNWIKVSADGSLTQSIGLNAYRGKEESYLTNFFATTNRDSFRSNTFTSFRRVRTGDELSQYFTVPLALSAVVNRDTSWHLNVNVDTTQELRYEAVTEEEKNVYIALRVDTRQSRPYSLSPSLRSEVFETLNSNGNAVEIGFDMAPKRGRVNATIGSLSLHLRRFNGEVEGDRVDYVEQDLFLSLGRSRSTWSWTAEETFVLGNGTISSGFGRHIGAQTTNAQSYSNNIQTNRDGTTYRTITKLYGVTGYGRPVSNRLEVLCDYLSTEDDGNLQMGLTHQLTYHKDRSFWYEMLNALTSGEGQTANSGALAGGELRVEQKANTTRMYAHSSKLTYSPSRSLTGQLSFDLKSQFGDAERSLHYGVTQNCLYTHYRVNGIVRALFSLAEEFTYEAAGSDSETELLLKANYAPFRHLSLEAQHRYELSARGEWEGEKHTSFLSANVSYALVSLRLIFERGVSSSTSVAARKDHGVKIQLDKVF